jgi:small nuclear ribonucleoprotein (snRNP)-like protein
MSRSHCRYLEKAVRSKPPLCCHCCFCRIHLFSPLVKLNGNRHISGVVRGFDPFMNLVLEQTVHEVSANERLHIGTVVSDVCLAFSLTPFLCGTKQKKVVRGNTIDVIEPLQAL